MKRLSFAAAIFLFITLFISPSPAQIGFGIFGGLSTPNDQFANIYNSNQINFQKENVIGNLLTQGINSGFHIGAGIRLPLSDNFSFIGSISLHRFPQNQLLVIDPTKPTNSDTLMKLNSTQNVIPFLAGVDFYAFRNLLGVLSIYATGDLTYNYISSSVDYSLSPGLAFPLSSDPSYSRVGYGLGVGFDFDVRLLLLNLEAKYNVANLIGRVSGEDQKNYFTLGLGVFFGSSYSSSSKSKDSD